MSHNNHLSKNDKKVNKANHGPGSGHGPMGMGAPVQKPDDFKATFKRLVKYLKPQLPKLIFVIILAIIGTVLMIITPKILGNATNSLQDGILKGALDMSYIMKIIYLVVVLYALAAIFSFISRFICASIAQKVVLRLRSDIKDKFSTLPIKFYDNHSTGDILSRITNDVDLIATSLQESVITIITSVIMVIGVIIMMFTINIWLTLIALATLPAFAIITILISKNSQKKFAAQQKELGSLNGKIEENIAGQQIIKLFGKEDEMIEDMEVVNVRLAKESTMAQFFAGMIMPILRFVTNIGYVALCIVGGILAGATNPLGIGDIQAFLQYSSQFSQPILQTATIANQIQSTIAAAERIFKLLDAEEEVADKENSALIENKEPRIEFNHVDFSYTAEKELMKDLNLRVKPYDRVAIVGPTGAGKTTLVNLLMRFYDINSGNIYLDGIDIRDYTKEDLRSQFGMVLQDTWLMHDTIRNNISYGKSDATEEEIKKAAKAAHADFFIDALPMGYDTVLDEDTSNLSQGQKQLITIARAILADNKILILDEATSSVDTRTEFYIQNAMTNMMKGKTCFIIAHRLSTIKNADIILVMNEGDIVEKGTHEELIKANGFYAELYNSQFNNISTQDVV